MLQDRTRILGPEHIQVLIADAHRGRLPPVVVRLLGIAKGVSRFPTVRTLSVEYARPKRFSLGGASIGLT